MFSHLGVPHLLIIAALIVLLFGAKKMPTMARSLGQSLRILKAETKGLREDDNENTPSAAVTPTPHATPATQLPAAQPAQEKRPTEDELRSQIDELHRKLDQVSQPQTNKNAG